MRRIIVSFLVMALGQLTAWAGDPPHVQRNGEATQLTVDGLPYLALAGELHNL